MTDTDMHYEACMTCHGCITGGTCILAPDYHDDHAPTDTDTPICGIAGCEEPHGPGEHNAIIEARYGSRPCSECEHYPCDHTGCDCDGTFHNPGPNCPGQPTVQQPPTLPTDTPPVEEECPECDGSGVRLRIVKEPCPTCTDTQPVEVLHNCPACKHALNGPGVCNAIECQRYVEGIADERARIVAWHRAEALRCYADRDDLLEAGFHLAVATAIEAGEHEKGET